MNKKFLAFSLAALFFLPGCGGPSKQVPESLHYQDLYPHGILTEEEREQRAELKQTLSEILPDEMRDREFTVSIKPQSVEVKVSFSDELVNHSPGGWPETVEAAQKVSSDLLDALQESDEQSAVLYLTDFKQILLTAMDGELLYNRFSGEKFESLELETTLDPESIDKAASQIIGEIDSKPEESISSSSIVYVSDKSNTIHSIPDCSGMKNYREMSEEQANANGYKYCPNCW